MVADIFTQSPAIKKLPTAQRYFECKNEEFLDNFHYDLT